MSYSTSMSDMEGSFVVLHREGSITEHQQPIQPVDHIPEPATPSPAHIEPPPAPQPATHPSLHSGFPGQGSYAHDWSDAATGGGIRRHGRHFVDAYGRVCNLRGVNLSGSSKAPIDHDHETFPTNHRTITFVGRPFPLEEAPEHFARLRRWGLTFIRFLVTWEAVEHEGPGIYDTAYLTYVRSLLTLLPEYGLCGFVCLHQDVWSRYSGGSGAPAWTLEAVGFDLHTLEDAGAAWLLGVKGGGHIEEERGIWPCGYQKLAAATMATCFWGGDVFAPKLKIPMPDGSEKPVQRFLQDAFLDMFDVVAAALSDLPGVIGFELMNEPHRGYIDLPSLHAFDYNTDLHLSHVPSAFQSFLLGAGHPTPVSIWTRSFPMPTRKTSSAILNPHGRSAWRADGPTRGRCVWEAHGVWGWDKVKDEGVVLRESYFKKDPRTGEGVEWYEGFYYPFVRVWAERMRRAGMVGRGKVLVAEPIPNEFCPASWTGENQPPNFVYAPHWYDLNALFAKAFGDFTVNVQGLSRGMFLPKALYWGQQGARDNFSLQIRNIVEAGYKALGEVPCLIGECGIPMDMNRKEAFKSENWHWQYRMMDAMMTALEGALVGFTLWNYNPDNDDTRGDDWNGENFSWFSRRRALPRSLLDLEQTSFTLDNGGRILPAVVRPYAAKTAGVPLRFSYEMNEGAFAYAWAVPAQVDDDGDGAGESSDAPAAGKNGSVGTPPLDGHPPIKAWQTEIYVPAQLTHGRALRVEGLREAEGDRWTHDEARQTLFIVPGAARRCAGARMEVRVRVHPPIRPTFAVNGFWSDFGEMIWSGCVVFVGVFLFFKFKVFA
ncbi:glycoside hydrolase family 5 protein [Coniophora puteana RWD-64-598 SS2]|uniref:Glycoside hydrolase family 5 protein n=1 Tax=Coniophora puteana (strain RWD-64-598) TaxID=741705 RepID=A0A5M3MKK5_CONPW|nr:glycoside hydrolase family 5 protein [Coniophora puteana RWD-64-598 SS2]EIW79596.1 glycoside hydrolase family 5 protein [Coniophora puteana RWD-64-598 SS2]